MTVRKRKFENVRKRVSPGNPIDLSKGVNYLIMLALQWFWISGLR